MKTIVDTFKRDDPILQRIFALMREHGESMTDLGRVCGLSRSSVSAWNTGRSESYKHERLLEKIAAHYSVSIGYLTGEKPTSEDEIAECLTALKNRSEMRTLFKVSKDATKDDIEQAVAIIGALKNRNQR